MNCVYIIIPQILVNMILKMNTQLIAFLDDIPILDIPPIPMVDILFVDAFVS